MEITVGGKVITLEYTFEAAERHECIDAAMDIFGGTMTAKIDSTHSEEMQVRDFLMSLSDLPRMAMDMFYACLKCLLWWRVSGEATGFWNCGGKPGAGGTRRLYTGRN